MRESSLELGCVVGLLSVSHFIEAVRDSDGHCALQTAAI